MEQAGEWEELTDTCKKTLGALQADKPAAPACSSSQVLSWCFIDSCLHKAGVTSFNSLSTAALNVQSLIGTNNQATVQQVIAIMHGTMLAAQNSGMLQRTDASVANGRMVVDRPGVTRLFPGNTFMTGNYGGGIRVWDNPETIRWHDAWDLVPVNGGNRSFIANEGGLRSTSR